MINSFTHNSITFNTITCIITNIINCNIKHIINNTICIITSVIVTTTININIIIIIITILIISHIVIMILLILIESAMTAMVGSNQRAPLSRGSGSGGGRCRRGAAAWRSRIPVVETGERVPRVEVVAS